MTVLLLKSSEGASDDGGWKDVFPGDLHVISPLGFQFVNSEELRVRLEDNSDSYSGLVCTSQRTVEALSRCMTTRQVAGRANIGGFSSGLNSGLIFLPIFFIFKDSKKIIKQLKPGFTNYQPQPKYSWALSKIEGKNKRQKQSKFLRLSDFHNLTKFQNYLVFRSLSEVFSFAYFLFPSISLDAQEYFGCGW